MLRAEAIVLMRQCFFSFIHGLSWVLQVVFLQRFFDATHSLVRGEATLEIVILWMIAMILAYMLTQIMNGVENCHSNILDLKVSRHKNMKMFKQIDKMNALEFEKTERLDYINKADAGGDNLVWVSLTLLDSILFYGTYFIAMGIFFFALRPSLSISILLVFTPCMLSNMIRVKIFEKLEDASAPVRRERDYYRECAIDLKETRFLGRTSYFEKLYYSCLQRLNHMIFKAQLKKNRISLLMELITVMGYGGILFLLLILVMQQYISIGAFVAVLASINSLFNFMDEVISERFAWAFENLASAENYLSFVDEEFETRDRKTLSERLDISLNGVSFKYPSTEKLALNNISLKINVGEKIAIVGENGSGKSTLCRLILGLYPFTNGEIKIGKESIENVSNEFFSAVFQEYCKYKMSIKDNITISAPSTNIDDDDLIGIYKNSGINIAEDILIQGIDTMIGRDFDGIELSGGQWQRLAIARGLFRLGHLIVLDEPTSAIDPLEETRLYNEFASICKDKTAIIVTHRLGSAQTADRIIVLKDGQLVEEGTHEELLTKDNEYKRMFDLQKQWYA